MKKKVVVTLKKQVPHKDSLSNQILKDKFAYPSKKSDDKNILEEEDFPPLPARGALKQSLAQLKEISLDDSQEEKKPAPSLKSKKKKKKPNKPTVNLLEEHDEDEEQVEVAVDSDPLVITDNVERLVEQFAKELDIDNDDNEAQRAFFADKPGPQRKLEDLFKDRISQKHTEIQSKIDEESVANASVSPETQEMMQEIGTILSRYRSGPLPKIFKVIPKMKGWEELVYLTNPDKWSAAAMYQATRIFVSNLQQSMAQRYLNLILLPRVRDDISYYKRLNFHIYQALCKALFKPAAFLKGILFPLCLSGDCTLREAIIIGSVIAKNQIPMLHSASAILKIAEMDYTGPNSIFLRIFFDKKYALPYRVVDAAVYHFIKFENDRRDLPVLWYQSLLAFVQKYKEDLSSDQKEALFTLLRFHNHYKITPEIRRELQNSKCRVEAMAVDQ